MHNGDDFIRGFHVWAARVFGDPSWLAIENDAGCCYIAFYNHDGDHDLILTCPGEVFHPDSLILELEEEFVELSIKEKTPREFIVSLLNGMLEIAQKTPVEVWEGDRDFMHAEWLRKVQEKAPVSLLHRVRDYAAYFGEREQLLEALIQVSKKLRELGDPQGALNEALKVTSYVPRGLSHFVYTRFEAEGLVSACLNDWRHTPVPNLEWRRTSEPTSSHVPYIQSLVRQLALVSERFLWTKPNDGNNDFFHKRGQEVILHFTLEAGTQWHVHNLITGSKQPVQVSGNGSEGDEVAALIWATASGWLEIMTAQPIKGNSLGGSWVEVWHGKDTLDEDDSGSDAELLSSAAGGIALLLVDCFRAWDFANTNRLTSDRSHLFDGLLTFINMLRQYELKNALIEIFELQTLGATVEEWLDVTDHFGEVHELPFEQKDDRNPKDMFIDFVAYSSQFDKEEEDGRNSEFYEPWRALHENRVTLFQDSDGVTRARIAPRDVEPE